MQCLGFGRVQPARGVIAEGGQQVTLACCFQPAKRVIGMRNAVPVAGGGEQWPALQGVAVAACMLFACDCVGPKRLLQVALVGVVVAALALGVGGIIDGRSQRVVVEAGFVGASMLAGVAMLMLLGCADRLGW